MSDQALNLAVAEVLFLRLFQMRNQGRPIEEAIPFAEGARGQALGDRTVGLFRHWMFYPTHNCQFVDPIVASRFRAPWFLLGHHGSEVERVEVPFLNGGK